MKTPRISFEVFPPKTDDGVTQLAHTLRELTALGPSFVSVTYGAGGSTRDRTREIVRFVHESTPVPVASHLTCVGATRDEVDHVAREYWNMGVRHVVALRGDPLPDASGSLRSYTPFAGGYGYATDLVRGLRAIGDFEISVAAYPEKHPESESLAACIDNLKRKLDAGATRALTQYFFEGEAFLRFRDRAWKAGVRAPIVPGILPVQNLAQVKKFSAACGANVPAWLDVVFAGTESDPEARRRVGTELAASMCKRLVREGADQIHLYTMNRVEPTRAICAELGIVPERVEAQREEAAAE